MNRDLPKLNIKDKLHATVNTVTDTPVLFEAGNSLIAWQIDPALAGVNILFGAFIGSVRFQYEKRKLLEKNGYANEEKSNPGWLMRQFEKFIGNPGASLETSGVILFGLGIVGLGMSALSMAPVMPAVILVGFGIANFSRGHAMRLQDNSSERKILEAFGIGFACLSCALVVPTAPIFAKLGLAAAFTAEVYKATTNKLPNGVSDLVFAAALAVNAFNSPSALNAAANGLFSFALVSLAAIKTKGGVAEYFRKDTIAPSKP